jgi:hypothetical protein
MLTWANTVAGWWTQHDGIGDPAPAAGDDDRDRKRDEAQAGEEEASEEAQAHMKVYRTALSRKPCRTP